VDLAEIFVHFFYLNNRFCHDYLSYFERFSI